MNLFLQISFLGEERSPESSRAVREVNLSPAFAFHSYTFYRKCIINTVFECKPQASESLTVVRA